MDAQKRRLWRAAEEIRQRIVQQPICVSLPRHRWTLIQKLVRQAESCQDFGWRLAADQLERNLRQQLRWLADDLNGLASSMHRQAPPELRATAAEIFRDLLALPHEFPELDCDLTAGTLWVVTKPIVLRSVALGPFKIELDFRRVVEFQPYRVIALKPNLPAGRRPVPHPHVQNDSLCEGEGRQAIKAALHSGRIYDFFEIVDRLLATYNSDSAYVQLSAWDGVCCTACGDSVPADDAIRCERCGDDLCADCANDCKTCGYSYCHECSSSCAACGWALCQACIKTCSQCDSIVCRECHKDGLCPACHEISEENQHESTDDDEPLRAEAAAMPGAS